MVDCLYIGQSINQSIDLILEANSIPFCFLKILYEMKTRDVEFSSLKYQNDADYEELLIDTSR